MKILDFFFYAGMLVIQGGFRRVQYDHNCRDTKLSAFLYLSFAVTLIILSLFRGIFPHFSYFVFEHLYMFSIASIIVALLLAIRYYWLKKTEDIHKDFAGLSKSVQTFFKITSPILFIGSLLTYIFIGLSYFGHI